MLYEYHLFNGNCIASLEGQHLVFYASNDSHAIELGKNYARKLGWANYTICYFNGEEEVNLYKER